MLILHLLATKGFHNWKFPSSVNKEAVLKTIILPVTTVNVTEYLSSQLKKEKLDRLTMLLESSFQHQVSLQAR